MKKLLLVSFLLSALVILPAGATTHLTGKIIALDAGHGNGATGAIGYCNGSPVVEADVNLAVRDALKVSLEADGATVFEVPQYASRKDRVTAVDNAGADVLISIHHNGSSDTSVDYTKSFVTQNKDKKLANPIHKALVAALGLDDKGIKHDGYGMTVYGSMPSVLTESFFITNEWEACNVDSRVITESQAMYDGLNTYFSENTGGGGGNGNKGGNGKGKNK